jgi:DNA-binding CsgD family transcriptional regulator
VSFAPSKTGFLLLDTSLNLVAANSEAILILSYPNRRERINHLNLFIAERVRSVLLDRNGTDQAGMIKEFQSGRRHYMCRSFRFENDGHHSPQAAIAVLLERNATGDVALDEICRQYDLSPRERETVRYLIQGMTTKEIATRLNISPNTVKAFLRLVMVKMNVSTRSGIVGRFTGARPSS